MAKPYYYYYPLWRQNFETSSLTILLLLCRNPESIACGHAEGNPMTLSVWNFYLVLTKMPFPTSCWLECEILETHLKSNKLSQQIKQTCTNFANAAYFSQKKYFRGNNGHISKKTKICKKIEEKIYISVPWFFLLPCWKSLPKSQPFQSFGEKFVLV